MELPTKIVLKEKMHGIHQAEGYDALKFRQTLNKSVINLFADLPRVMTSPSDDSALLNFSKFIQCFRHCLEEFPQIFLSCSSNPVGKSKNDSDVTLVFTEWLMMRLLSVLSTPYPTVIHESCEDIFVSLFQVVRAIDSSSFRRFCLRLLCLMSDLNSLSEDYSDGKEKRFIIEKYFSEKHTSFKNCEDLDLTDVPIVICDHLMCEKFQMKLTIIVGKLAIDFKSVLPDHYSRLWKALCLQIEIGGLNLKEISLMTIVNMIHKGFLPMSGLEVNYILDCLQSLVVFCCSQDMPEISESFEKAVASCLIAVSKSIKGNKSCTNCNLFIVARSIEHIMQVITNFGLSKIKSDVFYSAIFEATSLLVQSLDDCSLLSLDIVLQFQVTLCKFLRNEEIKHHEFLVPLFVCFMIIEALKNGCNTNEKTKGSSPFRRLTFSAHLSSQSSRFSNTWPAQGFGDVNLPVHVKMKNASELWSSVLKILVSSVRNVEISHCSERILLSNINIIITCLNILLQSSLKLQVKKSADYHIPITGQQNEVNSHMPSDVLSSVVRSSLTLCGTHCSSNHVLYQQIIDLCNCIICFQDLLPLSYSEHTSLCRMLSYPWVGGLNAAELLDLHMDSTIFGSLSQQIPFSVEVMKKCLHCLARLPSDISPKWRCFVLKLCFENEVEAIKLAAVRTMPVFLFSGIFSQLDDWRLERIIFQDENVATQVEIVKIIGQLNCILHSTSTMYRCKISDDSVSLFPEIFCSICDIGKDFDENKKFGNSSTISWLLNTFLQALKHSVPEVRRGLVSCVQSLFWHHEFDEDILHSVVQLATDPDSNVRKRFISVVQFLLKPSNKRSLTWTASMDDILMTKMRDGLNYAKMNGNLKLHQDILSTVCEIGKVANDSLLLICLISLLENVLSSIPSIMATARYMMENIAKARKYKMMDLFKVFRESICKFIAESLMTCSDVNKALIVIEKIYSVFGYGDAKSFLNNTQQLILPYLVSKENDHISPLLDLFSKMLDTHKRNLLMNNFPFIFSHLVRHCKKLELEKALHYVEKETELEFGSLLRCNYQHIHNELLLHLSTHPEQVYAGLTTLALKSKEQQGTGHIFAKKGDMANYLQPKLLGFLVFFDSQLLKSSVTLDDKKLALQSLICIMELMGSRHITTVRFKIMATLRIALRFKENDFPGICCKAWNTFVRSIEIGSLGPLLNQVVVALLPLLDVEPEAVSKILRFIVIENRSSLKEFFHELYFIPDIPELQEINDVLKEYTENPSSQSDFEAMLSYSLKGVTHENLEVKIHALAKLKQVLNSNQLSLHEHLLGKESVDHLLSNLIFAIMPVCRESDEKARMLLAECLGALGGVDPGRLELKDTSSEKEMNKFLRSVEDDNFAFALIQELAHSFLAAVDCRVQDCSAFAIQEALRIYKFSDRKQASRNSGIWKQFPPDIQEILNVLSNSQYKPLEKSKRIFPRPIYQSSVGNTFFNWVTNWFSDLLSNVKHDMAARLFHACSMICKYDLNCTLFLLPHVLVYALIDSNKAECEEIVKEVLAVLTHCEASRTTSDLCHLSSQTIFSVFDHLLKWTRCRQQMLNSEGPPRASGSKALLDAGYCSVTSFLSKIPQILLAKSSFNCHAYTRALMHLEQHLNDNPSDLQNNMSFLQKLYAALDEPDGVAGVSAVRLEKASLDDAILEHEATGDMQGASASYELAINMYPDDVNYYGGLLKCFIRTDQPSTALAYVNGIIFHRPSWEKDLNSYRVEAAWKLADWASLDQFLKNEVQSDKWSVGVGRLLMNANNEVTESFEEEIKKVRCCQIAPLSAASMESGAYLRGYDHLTRLHMLTDLQQSVKAFWSSEAFNLHDRSALIDKVLSEWEIRQQVVQSSLRYQEPIFDLQRVVLKMGKAKFPELTSKIDQEIASSWLKSAKLARKSGHQQRAYSCLLKASEINSPALFMEKTKLHWNKLEKDQAIKCLQKGIEDHFPGCISIGDRSPGLTNEKLLMCAKAKLLLSVYSEESAIVDSNRLIQMYREVVTVKPQWEESHFHLAKYYDKMLPTVEEKKTKAEIMVHICKSFGTSLRYGCKHVYHSLPRLLDIWFDIGSQVAEQQRNQKANVSMEVDRSIEMALNQLTTIVIPDLYERLPFFLFMTALPQMISRICHSHPDVSRLLQKIIAKVLVAHSQQSIWMMIAVSKSSYPMRVQRCKKIFQEATLLKPELGKFIHDTTKLSDKLLELSNKIVKDSTLSIKEHFPVLPRMVEDRNFSAIMLPLQSQLIVTLPCGYSSDSSHNPFPYTPICIGGFQDTVEIFASLQRPKKLTIKGSDGKLYGLICKPKDDLRKDCRLMEFNNLVNRYLKIDPETRKRQLYIRTYAVVPLNEECGLIEWVPNLSGFRIIITKIYKSQGMYVTGKEIKAMMPHRTATPEQKLSIFMNKFLPKFPSVFKQWFLSTFPDPTAWYLARLAYARTTAVMSMVGYIVGLGDRHGENILLDSSCGDIVHVDLNCLFNKGETMECPECVPFRLTRNMVDAMGPTGYEGVFRKSCEVTMKVMRNRTDALMSVLRPFIHDPLVEWSRTSRTSRPHPLTSGELRNELGLTHVKDIEQRLKGIIKAKNKPQGLPLSIEGQVNFLIQEATDVRNLSQMYIGWTPYM